MDRIKEITINGKEYPLNFSVEAYRFAEENCGGAAKLFEEMNAEGVRKFPALLSLLAVMIDQGATYIEITTGEQREKLTKRQLESLLHPGDCTEVWAKMVEAINAGFSREIEAEFPKKKEEAEAEDSPSPGSLPGDTK